jgi:hypothetical protein
MAPNILRLLTVRPTQSNAQIAIIDLAPKALPDSLSRLIQAPKPIEEMRTLRPRFCSHFHSLAGAFSCPRPSACGPG